MIKHVTHEGSLENVIVRPSVQESMARSFAVYSANGAACISYSCIALPCMGDKKYRVYIRDIKGLLRKITLAFLIEGYP